MIERRGSYTPVEVKYTEHPTPKDARHVLAFLADHPKKARHGYVVCRAPRPMQLHARVTAIPWQQL